MVLSVVPPLSAAAHIIPAAASAVALAAAVLTIPAVVSVADHPAVRVAALAQVVVRTAVITQGGAAQLHRVDRPALRVAVITAAAIMACIDGMHENSENLVETAPGDHLRALLCCGI